MRSNIFSTVAHLASTTSLTRPALLAALAVGAVLAPSPSFALDDGALPMGESVVGGNATFDRSIVNVLNIHQNTDRVVINWDSFNIGAKATTEFFQPGAGSLAVNRVLSKGTDPTLVLGTLLANGRIMTDPTFIFGTLRANGRVMVLDRNGVILGKGSTVDVGSIVASTGYVRTEDVMSGAAKIVLTNLGETGSVINEGLIKVSDGGLAAFVAPNVRNSGIITAKLGKVVLAAGTETATVDLYGDGLVELAVSKDGAKVLSENSGVINAEGGTVTMTASAAKDVVDTVVNMSGVINASSAKMVGGKIILSAGGGKVKVSGKANVSGKSAGSVKVTGTDVEMTETSDIVANGIETGNGGDVNVYGEKSVVFKGNISAEGGSSSGNGGTVEVSTKGDLVFTGGVSTLAANGSAGALIIDPTVMTIHSGIWNWPFGSVNYLSNDLLSALLAGNGTVTIQATDTVNVGTTSSGFGIGTSDIDVSRFWLFGWHPTLGNLNLKASTVNFVKNLTVGNGTVSVDAATLNLNSKVYGKDGGSTVLLGDDRLNSTDSLTTINVQSPNAKIQQAISFANDGVNINVGNGTYNESVNVDKGVSLYGSNAIITPNSPGFYVTADNATVDGFEIVGADTGIFVKDADYVTLNNNYVHSLLSGYGVRVENSSYTEISNNRIHDTPDDGIHLDDGVGASIFRNTVVNCGNDCIDVHNNQDAEIRNNIVTGASDNGIEISYSNYAEITGNRVSSASNRGLKLTNSYEILARGNIIKNSGSDGIYLQNSDYSEIVGNIISNSGDDGIDARSEYGTLINGNIIGASGNNGIKVADTDDLEVSWNWVNNSGSDGVHVDRGNGVLVAYNNVRDSGYDGISVSDAGGYWDTKARPMMTETSYPSYYDAKIIGNFVRDSGNNGIASYNVPRILIKWNNVSNSGFFGGYDTVRSKVYDYSYSGDGIHVETSDGNYRGGDVLVDVLGNWVSNSGDDGIDVDFAHNDQMILGKRVVSPMVLEDSADSDYVSEPYIWNNVGINILGNVVYNSRDDGIVVSLHDNNDYLPSRVMMDFSPYDYGITAVDVLIAHNFVNNPVDIPVDIYDPEISLAKASVVYEGSSSGDGIEVNSYFSPWSNIETNTTVRNNFVANSGENGVYFSGPSHDFITMAGNMLIDNPVGANFESGEIDLTGETNTIIGGEIGLLFRPYLLGYEYNYDYGYEGDYSAKMMMIMPPEMTPVYAPMSLVDDTIGTTAFEGQGTYYVELDNGAFFDPGRPTLLNGLDASYDGFSPSSQGGVLTQDQYNYLESMFYHYRDDDSLGLFFFGTVPQLGSVSQEDIFRIFGGFNPKTPSGGLVITGLPSIGGGGAPQAGGTGAGGGNPFANIAPAAGEEEGDNNANLDPNTIEPNAGGDTNDAACWGDATNILGQGSAVSYSFGDEGTKLLDKAASCGNAQQPL